MEVLSLVLPIFAIMVTGFAVRHTNLLPEDTADVLIQFVFYIATPALLFVVIAQEEAKNLLNLPFLFVLGGGMAAFYFAILLGALFWKKQDLGSATMLTAMCSLSNTGFVALPILHATFGHKGVLPAAIANIIVVAFFLVTVALFERAKAGSDEVEDFLVRLRRTLTNPVILSTLIGVVWAISGLGLPAIATDYLNLLAAALTPCALFAIGMSIKLDSLRDSGTTIAFASVVKLVALPAAVFGLAHLADLSPLLTIAATIAAAVPTAKTSYLLANQYDQPRELVADTISVTTLISTGTLILWLVFLAHMYPSAFST